MRPARLLLFLSLACLAGRLWADQFYRVGASRPYTTFSAALAQVLLDHPGAFTETVRVQADTGTYAELVQPPLGLSPQGAFPLVLEPAPGHNPVIASGGAYGLRLSGVANVVLQGLRFRDHGVNAVRADAAPGLRLQQLVSTNSGAAELHLQGCPGAVVLGCRLSPATGSGLVVFDSPAVQISSNQVAPLGGGYSYGIILQGSPSSRLDRNEAYEATQGLGLFSSAYLTASANVAIARAGQRGMIVDNAPHSLIYNCLLVGQDIGLEMQGSTSCAVYNNTVWEHGTAAVFAHAACAPLRLFNNLLGSGFVSLALDATTQGGLTSDFNDYQAGYAVVTGGGNYASLPDWQVVGQDLNGSELLPGFLNAGGADAAAFKLNPASPLKELGANLAAVFSEDYFGNGRPLPTQTPWDPGFHAPSGLAASPSPSPTPSPTFTQTPVVPTATPTSTLSPTFSPTPTPPPASTSTPTATVSPTPTATAYPFQKDRVIPYPNPFRPGQGGELNIVFEPADEATVRIFDQAGALVVELDVGRIRATLGHARWDGRDGAGNVVASGLYLAAVRTPKLWKASRFAVLR